MQLPYLLHIFSPSTNVSPFDINMAYEAGYDAVIPYSGVALEDIYPLTQDTIFSRDLAGIKRTGIFIGGREFGVAIDMLTKAKAAMVPPFEVSVFVDPSGAITTAAAMVACIEGELKNKTGDSLEGKRVHIIGGTGPVGLCAGIIATSCGANVFLLSHRGLKVGQDFAEQQSDKFGVVMQGGDGRAQSLGNVLRQADIIISSAKAGIRVIAKSQLEQAATLLVVADANAVPPLGVEGIDEHDMGKVLNFTPNQAVGIGALAIGGIKYKVHRHILEMMKTAEQPLYIDYAGVFKMARQYVAK